MLKKSITFKTLDGNTVTQDFWFNLSKAEIATMELSAKGGSMSKLLIDIVRNQDPAGIISTFELFITKAYGIRSDDNVRFIKSEEIAEGFKQTDAYSELFMEMVTNAESAALFIQGIVPPEVNDNLKKNETTLIKDLQLPPTREEENASLIAEAPYLQPGQNAPYLELPPRGDEPELVMGPFSGLTQQQVNTMSRDEQVTYITNPEAFKK